MRRASVAVLLVWVVAAGAQTSDSEPPPPPGDKDVAESFSVLKESGLKAETPNEETRSSARDDTAEGDSKRDNLEVEASKNRFFGRYSTTTETAVVMVTSTVFFSCLSGTSMGVCLGRRKKKDLQLQMELQVDPEQRVHLDSSLDTDAGRVVRSIDDALGPSSAAEEEAEADSKYSGVNNQSKLLFGFNVWTRTRITTTVTMLFTDTNTTIRLSYYCQAGNLQLPQFNCAG